MIIAEAAGLIGFIVLIALLLFGVPIGAALLLVGFAGLALLISPEAALAKTGVIAFGTVSRYELGVLPLFMLMAQLCFAAGASGDFFAMTSRFFGHRRGGLAIASVAGCAGFGAVSGSSLATVATVSAVALPEMRAKNYDPGFAAGTLAAGGTLGSLTPPSGALIVYGIIAEQSIGKLFGAAIVPVVTQALFYVVVIALLCRFNPRLGPSAERASWGERMATLRRVADIGLLIVFVIGGLVVGWFTPTEAASVGCVGAFAVLALRRRFTLPHLTAALSETLRISGMIYLILIGALLFSTFVSVTGLVELMSGLVHHVSGSPAIATVVMAIVLLLLGSFLDGLALMLLMTPILLPIATGFGLNPIWFGIFLVRTMEIGFVHPPLGLNIYVIQAQARDVPLGAIFRGIVPFLLSDFVHLGLLIAFPAIALWLPGAELVRRFAVALAAALALTSCAPPPPGARVLTYASPYPATHPFSRADIAWMKWVERASGGRIRIKPYWGGALLSSDENLFEIRHGVADIGMVTPIYARSAHIQRIQPSFYSGVRSIPDQVRVYHCLAAEFPAMNGELKGLHVLAVQGGSFPGILTRDRPVRRLSDLRGLRLRAQEDTADVLRALGADPVSMSMADVYSAMAKGVIDGVVAPVDALKAVHLADVGRYFSALRVPRGAYPARAMSERVWEQLTPGDRDLFTRSEAIWEDAIRTELDQAVVGGRRYADAEGLQQVPLVPGEAGALRRPLSGERASHQPAPGSLRRRRTGDRQSDGAADRQSREDLFRSLGDQLFSRVAQSAHPPTILKDFNPLP